MTPVKSQGRYVFNWGGGWGGWGFKGEGHLKQLESSLLILKGLRKDQAFFFLYWYVQISKGTTLMSFLVY